MQPNRSSISALQRAWLLPRDGSTPNPTAEAKFSLNATIGDEGKLESCLEDVLKYNCLRDRLQL